SNARWKDYQQHFVQNDGRIIDLNDTGKSTSEGQAYALFHALVANDRTTFASVLRWLQDNLAKGDLANNLPAWKWGKTDADQWAVLEQNNAADADLWIAYTLLEAGRLWQIPDYQTLGLAFLHHIQALEVEEAKGLGPVVLSAVHGFKLSDCQWRLNPSYFPIQLFRGLASHDPKGPWNELATTSAAILIGSSPKGVAPDWIVYDPTQGFIPDKDTGDIGSYDAIRVYLWLGMLSDQDPLKAPLVKHMQYQCDSSCWPPTETRTLSGVRYGEGSAGFKAAVLPWLTASSQDQCLQTTLAALQTSKAPTPPNYYDENLTLFALGWHEQAFRFDRDGRLQPAWKTTCP
ncbi:unnamed protein product, partial [Cyprideis torosa]